MVMFLKSRPFSLVPHIVMLAVFKNKSCNGNCCIATAVGKEACKAFLSIMRKGKIISNEISGSEMREF